MEDIKIEMKKDLDNMNDAPPLKQKKKCITIAQNVVQ